jgi:2-polyprenyl-3-methyl-5-hydroxy-6-metoxy-1,4-benzoquinol methylase
MATLVKPDWYYTHARREISTLLPASVGRVLEIGCSNGATLAWLRTQGATHTVGVEYVPEVAAQARSAVDEVYTGDVEAMELPSGPFDLILCLDVFEHLRDPWRLASRLASLLAPSGALITSIPNARNFALVKQLVLHGRFDYAPEGIMDHTHLRWFTRRTAIDLLTQAGLTVDAIDIPSRRDPRVRFKNALTLGLLREFWDFQYLIRAHYR